ncbi:MAG: DUF7282 domain-containing protein [Myxococcota bacterium]
MTRRWLLVVLLSFIPLAACGDNGQEANNDGTSPPVTDNYAIEGGSLIDPDTVSIGRVDTVDPSWIVVFEGTTLLGHTGVDVGESTDVEVPLDVSLSSGPHTLEAVLYRDEGAVEQFEVPGNDRPILENGELVATSFDVTVEDEFSPEISASDQTISSAEAGAVTIDSATARDDAWVVVRSGACVDSPDDAGEIRGVRAISRGEQPDVVVDVTPEVSDGETLCAYLHEDAPKDGDFTYEDDAQEDPPVNIEGTFISAEWTVSVEGAAGDPLVEASDQDVSGTSPNQVTIDRVVSQDAGWIVIHRGSCSTDGEVVGQASVVDGENTDVAVEFDDGEWILGSNAQFCAMLHADNPEDGDFTYDGENSEDIPILDEGGNPITDAFVVTVQPPQDPELTIQDQLLTTNEVTVASVYVPSGIWLALYTDDAGARGQLIGWSQISPTPLTDVIVEIDQTLLGRALVDGETLHVAAHEDNPNDETFDTVDDGDPVATDGAGNEFSTSFTVTVPTLLANDQTADPATSLNIDRVRSAGPGWLAAYDGGCPDAGASWGSRLGFTSVSDGESTDVTLTLDTAATDQQTICVTLHADDPDDDTFENTTPTDAPDAATTSPTGDIVQSEIVVSVP